MSQLAPTRPLSRPSARRPPAGPRHLKVVAPPEIRGNGAFLALCIALLLAGFVAVLLLNTAMAKGSFTMRDLQLRSDRLTDTQASLQQSIDAVSGPGPLAKRARAMGMVPAETAAFLRLSDATVLGVAKPAARNTRFDVVTESSPPVTRTPVPPGLTLTPTTPAGTPPSAVPTPGTSATPSAGTPAHPQPSSSPSATTPQSTPTAAKTAQPSPSSTTP
jgi:hypothetical protein